MAVSLPYLASNKNVETLFSKIQSAKIPDKFTQEFLKTTIGLKGSNDRSLITLLKSLGFIDQGGAPTSAYRLLKNSESAKTAAAQAIRTAYGPLFMADENVHKLSSEKLRGLIAQVAGTDDDMTARIAATFNALVKRADFSGSSNAPDEAPAPPMDSKEDNGSDNKPPLKEASNKRPMHPEFHYNIQVHLPSNGTEEVYINIFNALRKAFQ
jgi:Family of unknown function (DUF5343)